jgi:hypothetical protein
MTEAQPAAQYIAEHCKSMGVLAYKQQSQRRDEPFN